MTTTTKNHQVTFDHFVQKAFKDATNKMLKMQREQILPAEKSEALFNEIIAIRELENMRDTLKKINIRDNGLHDILDMPVRELKRKFIGKVEQENCNALRRGAKLAR
jgi:hypothetical protein